MIKSEKIGAFLFRDITWKFQGQEKELFLTFDDGPEPEITEWVLSVLEDFNAKATFFCIGNKVEQFPDLYQKILHKGHAIGNHTYSHFKGWSTASKTYVEDVKRASQHIDSKLFRPPYGRIRPYQLKELKKDFKIIMWDILSKDYDNHTTKEECLQNVLDYSESGSIIVFHDKQKAKDKLMFVLPKVLEYFAGKGFRFSSIPSND